MTKILFKEPGKHQNAPGHNFSFRIYFTFCHAIEGIMKSIYSGTSCSQIHNG